MTPTPHTVLVIYVRATPERIFAALTSREESRRFFHETDLEPRLGGHFRLLNDDGEAIVAGKVLEFDPPRLLRMSWKELSEPDSAPGEVEYHIEPAGLSTRLTVSNFDRPAPSAEYIAMGRNGWSFTLSSLKSLLENGEALPPLEPEPRS